MSITLSIRNCTACGIHLAPQDVIWVRREPGRGLENYDAYCVECAPAARAKAAKAATEKEVGNG